MDDRQLEVNYRQQRKAGRVFRKISIVQITIHLGAYLAAFIKLIMIEGGGYYDIGVIYFIVMTIISMPLFAIGWRFLQRSFKLSPRHRFWGYCFHLVVSIWSIVMVKISYSI